VVLTGRKLRRIDSPLSFKQRAYTIIKEAILNLELEPGAPLVEAELSEQLGISKTPVRDALQELEREGFVVRVPFTGTYVAEITPKDVTEVFQLRGFLEGIVARQVAGSFMDEELDQLAANLEAAEVALREGDLALCSDRNRTLHDAIVDKVDNERLHAIIHNLDDHVLRFGALSDRIGGRLDVSLVEHHRILTALRDRDPVGAEEAMLDHYLSVLQDLASSEIMNGSE